MGPSSWQTPNLRLTNPDYEDGEARRPEDEDSSPYRIRVREERGLG
ncbi:MAG: hypothetical protein ACREJ3_15865 [Polyangiaceae bacterium]